jgi:serine/threonine-protein kinase RsbW
MEDPEESLPVTVVFPAQYEFLEEVREFVASKADRLGLDSAGVYAVQLAVDEAFTNIIEHAYGGECAEEIECTCQITPASLEITLKDCGNSFNPDEVPDPDFDTELEKRQVGGLGLYFIRRLMDEVQFSIEPEESGKPGCNILRMVKRKENVG